MRTFSKNPANLLIMSIMVLTMAFTFSCEQGPDPSVCNGVEYDLSEYECVGDKLVAVSSGGSSSSGGTGGGNSSSSGGNTPLSSACVNPSSYDSFNAVVIGTQTWMKENLNYNACGSRCYDNKPANCEEYGRLYKWATAMNLPASCDSTYCSSQINAKHRGICPENWHIPSDAEWDQLYRYADGTNGPTSPYRSPTAGRYLKATSGWDEDGNGEDRYGFTALPSGGIDAINSLFSIKIGRASIWWSSTELRSDEAFVRGIVSNSDLADWASFEKNNLYSVRCVHDSSISSTPSIPSYSTPVYRQFNSVSIGSQVWMAENLHYNVMGSKCYNNDPANCDKYGNLYSWTTAMDLPDNCNSLYNDCSSQIKAKHRGICPEGWHIPNNAEWDQLYRYADGTDGTDSLYGSPTAGRYLKATSGWDKDGNGLDRQGFAALPGGFGDLRGTSGFSEAGEIGVWWSSEQVVSNIGYSSAYVRRMYYNSDRAYSNKDLKGYMFSVRCIQD